MPTASANTPRVAGKNDSVQEKIEAPTPAVAQTTRTTEKKVIAKKKIAKKIAVKKSPEKIIPAQKVSAPELKSQPSKTESSKPTAGSAPATKPVRMRNPGFI